MGDPLPVHFCFEYRDEVVEGSLISEKVRDTLSMPPTVPSVNRAGVTRLADATQLEATVQQSPHYIFKGSLLEQVQLAQTAVAAGELEYYLFHQSVEAAHLDMASVFGTVGRTALPPLIVLRVRAALSGDGSIAAFVVVTLRPDFPRSYPIVALEAPPLGYAVKSRHPHVDHDTLQCYLPTVTNWDSQPGAPASQLAGVLAEGRSCFAAATPGLSPADDQTSDGFPFVLSSGRRRRRGAAGESRPQQAATGLSQDLGGLAGALSGSSLDGAARRQTPVMHRGDGRPGASGAEGPPGATSARAGEGDEDDPTNREDDDDHDDRAETDTAGGRIARGAGSALLFLGIAGLVAGAALLGGRNRRPPAPDAEAERRQRAADMDWLNRQRRSQHPAALERRRRRREAWVALLAGGASVTTEGASTATTSASGSPSDSASSRREGVVVSCPDWRQMGLPRGAKLRTTSTATVPLLASTNNAHHRSSFVLVPLPSPSGLPLATPDEFTPAAAAHRKDGGGGLLHTVASPFGSTLNPIWNVALSIVKTGVHAVTSAAGSAKHGVDALMLEQHRRKCQLCFLESVSPHTRKRLEGSSHQEGAGRSARPHSGNAGEPPRASSLPSAAAATATVPSPMPSQQGADYVAFAATSAAASSTTPTATATAAVPYMQPQWGAPPPPAAAAFVPPTPSGLPSADATASAAYRPPPLPSASSSSSTSPQDTAAAASLVALYRCCALRGDMRLVKGLLFVFPNWVVFVERDSAPQLDDDGQRRAAAPAPSAPSATASSFPTMPTPVPPGVPILAPRCEVAVPFNDVISIVATYPPQATAAAARVQGDDTSASGAAAKGWISVYFRLANHRASDESSDRRESDHVAVLCVTDVKIPGGLLSRTANVVATTDDHSQQAAADGDAGSGVAPAPRPSPAAATGSSDPALCSFMQRAYSRLDRHWRASLLPRTVPLEEGKNPPVSPGDGQEGQEDDMMWPQRWKYEEVRDAAIGRGGASSSSNSDADDVRHVDPSSNSNATTTATSGDRSPTGGPSAPSNVNGNAGGGAAPCVVCLDRPKGAFFSPCGHVAVCVECARRLDKCPVCRCHIDSALPAYIT